MSDTEIAAAAKRLIHSLSREALVLAMDRLDDDQQRSLLLLMDAVDRADAHVSTAALQRRPGRPR